MQEQMLLCEKGLKLVTTCSQLYIIAILLTMFLPVQYSQA